MDTGRCRVGGSFLEGHCYIRAVVKEEEEHIHVVAHGVAQDEGDVWVDGDLSEREKKVVKKMVKKKKEKGKDGEGRNRMSSTSIEDGMCVM